MAGTSPAMTAAVVVVAAFRVAVTLAFVLIVVTTAFAAWVVSLGPLPLEQARKVSTTIVDRNGKLLRAYAMADGRWRLPVDAKTAVDPGLSQAAAGV